MLSNNSTLATIVVKMDAMPCKGFGLVIASDTMAQRDTAFGGKQLLPEARLIRFIMRSSTVGLISF